MIVVWLSLDNRRQRRAMTARARKAGLEIKVQRACAEDVFAHIVQLTDYIENPDPKKLAELYGVEAGLQLLAYMTSEKGNGDRVLLVASRNLLTDTLEDQQWEFGLTSGMSPGQDPMEHIMISWPDGVHPTPEQVERTIDLLLEVADMEQHQLLAALHGDTAHTHLHIALNRVHPVSGERHQFGGPGQNATEVLHQVIAVAAHRECWPTQGNALYRADDSGCYERETGRKVLDDRLQACFTKADWKAVFARREERDRERKLSPASLRYERRTGLHSLHRVALEEAGPIIKSAGNAEELHRGLGRIGIRYRMLSENNAVLEFGDRTIAASRAGWFASADKLHQRLKNLDPPHDLQIIPWTDREHPKRRDLVRKDRQLRAIRLAQMAHKESAAHAKLELAQDYNAACAAMEKESWKGRGEVLNALRQSASRPLKEARDAIDLLWKQENERRKRRRARARADLAAENALLDPAPDQVVAVLVGREIADYPVGSITVPGFTAEHRDGAVYYSRNERLAFVEHRNHIDVYAARNEDALRAALRLGAAKWGRVSVTGDDATLERFARIAVDEQIEIANPELQQLIEQLRAAKAVPAAAAVAVIEPPSPAKLAAGGTDDDQMPRSLNSVLNDYDPAFTSWNVASGLEAADADERALAIVETTKLAAQLEELKAEGYAIASSIKVAARRAERSRASLTAIADSTDVAPTPATPDTLTLDLQPVLPDSPPAPPIGSEQKANGTYEVQPFHTQRMREFGRRWQKEGADSFAADWRSFEHILIPPTATGQIATDDELLIRSLGAHKDWLQREDVQTRLHMAYWYQHATREEILWSELSSSSGTDGQTTKVRKRARAAIPAVPVDLGPDRTKHQHDQILAKWRRERKPVKAPYPSHRLVRAAFAASEGDAPTAVIELLAKSARTAPGFEAQRRRLMSKAEDHRLFNLTGLPKEGSVFLDRDSPGRHAAQLDRQRRRGF